MAVQRWPTIRDIAQITRFFFRPCPSNVVKKCKLVEKEVPRDGIEPPMPAFQIGSAVLS
jgi:hypothetical protein